MYEAYGRGGKQAVSQSMCNHLHCCQVAVYHPGDGVCSFSRLLIVSFINELHLIGRSECEKCLRFDQRQR